MSTSFASAPKILVADDDDQILEFVETILNAEGYQTIRAKDGKEAYKLLQSKEHYDAAILDIMMPYIEGGDLLKFMQTEKRFMRIPVIITTGDPSPRLSSSSFAAGAVAFLPKPFTAPQLTSMLRMCIRSNGAKK